MRFWKRIVIYSMVLFMIVFNSVGVVLIEYLHSSSMKNTVSSTLFQFDGIVSAIYLNSDNTDDVRDNFDTFIKSYLSFENQGISNIEVYSGNGELITSKHKVEYKGDRKEIKEASLDEKKFVIKNVYNKKYLFVSQSIKISNKIYKIILSKSINNIFEERINLYKVFLILDIVTAVILSFGMYLIAKKITRPIENLTKTSLEISKGEYEKRADVIYKDEVGILASNFNEMLDILQNNIEELRDINESKQRFIDNLTHESKTPITSILGYSDILLNGNITEDMRIKALNYINREAKRLEELNSTLLKLTLLKNNNPEVEIVNIKDVIKASIKSLHYILNNKNIKIHIDAHDYGFLCDKKLLNIIITNILENSVKASFDKSNITVRSQSERDVYSIDIIDSGIGVSEEDLIKIREPFFIADKSRGGKNKGLGLGLSICEEICEMFNIKLSIKSKVNEGTIVSLTFKGEKDEKNNR